MEREKWHVGVKRDGSGKCAEEGVPSVKRVPTLMLCLLLSSYHFTGWPDSNDR